MTDPRARILERIRQALAPREAPAHPGALAAAPAPPPGTSSAPADTLTHLRETLEAAGGEMVRLEGAEATTPWLSTFVGGFATAAVGSRVPASLRPGLPEAEPAAAELGVSVARGAVAETGSVILDARDGRAVQLLPPTHLVWVASEDVHATLGAALRALRSDLPSALALHSGPSKSADIGQILVRGVHGPGRLVVAVVDSLDDTTD